MINVKRLVNKIILISLGARKPKVLNRIANNLLRSAMLERGEPQFLSKLHYLGTVDDTSQRLESEFLISLVMFSTDYIALHLYVGLNTIQP
jgi:hypothetical protein